MGSALKRFFHWLQHDDGWKVILAVVYAVICLFDFILIPAALNITRKEVIQESLTATLAGLDPTVQVEFVKAIYRQYTPLTIQGNGVFHLAFGALLTGSALSKSKENT